MAEESSEEESEGQEEDSQEDQESENQESEEEDQDTQDSSTTQQPSDEELEEFEVKYKQTSPTYRGKQAREREAELLNLVHPEGETDIDRMYSYEKTADYHTSPTDIAGQKEKVELRDGDDEDITTMLAELDEEGRPVAVFVPDGMADGYRTGGKVLKAMKEQLGEKKTAYVKVHGIHGTDERSLIVVHNGISYRPASVTSLIQKVSPEESMGDLAREQTVGHMVNTSYDALFIPAKVTFGDFKPKSIRKAIESKKSDLGELWRNAA